MTQHIPIIAHTAWPPEVWKEKALKAGVSEYLTKPTPPAVLKETIEKLSEQSRVTLTPSENYR